MARIQKHYIPLLIVLVVAIVAIISITDITDPTGEGGRRRRASAGPTATPDSVPEAESCSVPDIYEPELSFLVGGNSGLSLVTGAFTAMPEQPAEDVEPGGYLVRLSEPGVINEETKDIFKKSKGRLGSSGLTGAAVLDNADRNKLGREKDRVHNSQETVKRAIRDRIRKEPVSSSFLASNTLYYQDLSEDDIATIKRIVDKVVPNIRVVALLDGTRPIVLGTTNPTDPITFEGRTLTGAGVTIEVSDTGVDYTHPDLGDNYVGGYDFVNDDNDPMDDQGHGTHVSGIAAGNGGLLGIATGASILGAKVLDYSGGGYLSDVLASIDYAIDPNNDGDYSDAVDILSMSLGASGTVDDVMSEAVNTVVEAGVVAVIAAGNSGPSSSTMRSPGTALKAITVAASDDGDAIAFFSSRGPARHSTGAVYMKPELSAPGVNVCAAQWGSWSSSNQCLDNDHISISGTSMATPTVSGAAALVLEAHPAWSPAFVKSALVSTALDVGQPAFTQGAGRLRVPEALAVKAAMDPISLSINTPGTFTSPVAFTNVHDQTIRVRTPDSFIVQSQQGSQEIPVEPLNFCLAPGETQNKVLTLGEIPSGIGLYSGILRMSAVSDTANAPPQPTPPRTVTETVSYAAGWHIFTLPLQNTGISDAAELLELFGEASRIVYKWEGNSWRVYLQGQPYPFSIVDGESYMVYVESPIEIPITGQRLPSTATMELSNGFNYVGVPIAYQEGMDVAWLASQIGDSDVIVYMLEGNSYTIHLASNPSYNNFALDNPARGLIIAKSTPSTTMLTFP